MRPSVRPAVCWTCRLWQASRSMATLQKRQPSRMTLSPKVAQKSLPSQVGGKKHPRGPSDPFSGMNKTAVDVKKLRQKTGARRIPQAGASSTKDRGNGKAKARAGGQPFKALKMQRALSPVSYNRRTEVKQSLVDKDSFANFALLPAVRDAIGPQALRGKLDAAPSPIQRLAIPALLGTTKEYRQPAGATGMQQYLLAAETGSGKTLAYLLPVLDAFKRTETKEKEQRKAQGLAEAAKPVKDALWELALPERNQPDPDTGRPRVIILVPTAELVDQVGSVVKSLSHAVKFRSALLSSTYSGAVIRNRLFSPGGVDVVVSTPHLLSSIVESDPNILSRANYLIVDEADSLLDRSFSESTRPIIERASPSLKQLVFCSATIPRNMDSHLRKHYPDIIRLTTPNLHAIPRRVQLSVVDIEGDPYKSNRNLACADTIWNMGKEMSNDPAADRLLRLIVFVNERETTEEVAGFLREKGIDAVALNRDATDRQTSDVLAEFTGMPVPVRKSGETTPQPVKPSGRAGARNLANVKVIVMTDIGSRGVDTLEVKNVILYDVPHTSIDFIHRLGRVGRMNRRGRGIVLVGKGDRKDVVKEVRTGMFMGKALI